MIRFWQPNVAAIREACNLLQILEPVWLRIANLVSPSEEYEYIAAYSNNDRPHVLFVNTGVRPDEISTALWHELRHAQQRERGLEMPVTAKLVLDGGLVAYLDHPLEEECRATAEQFAEYPLIQSGFGWGKDEWRIQ